jgi:hypothetical protein
MQEINNKCRASSTSSPAVLWTPRSILLAVLLVALAPSSLFAQDRLYQGDNDEATPNPPRVMQPQGNKPPRAKLHLRKVLAHWIHANASGSSDPHGYVEFYRFWVTDAGTGTLVAGPLDGDGPHRYFALGPGDYDVHVQVTDNDGATDTVTKSIAINPEVKVTTNGAICSTARRASRRVATCSLPAQGPTPNDLPATTTANPSATLPVGSGTYTIDLEELATAAGASDNTPMWFQALGARGGNGSTSGTSKGGDGGNGGSAVTTTDISDFQSIYGTTTIYYYVGQDGIHNGKVGGSGGASTLILTTSSTAPSVTLSQVVLIAAGGGGGAGADLLDPGHDGGVGGCAIAHRGSPGTGTGDNGHGGDSGGGGGNGVGGSMANVGTSFAGGGGIGGFGGSNSFGSTGWINADVSFDNGHGGMGYSGGGGGYGGGGGGGEKLGGAGGGGSYSAAATQTSTQAPTSCKTSNSNGSIQVSFDLGM